MAINTPEQDASEEQRLNIPDVLPVLPLRGMVVFPFAPTPLVVGQERSIRLIDEAMRGNRLIAVAAQIDPSVEQAGPEGIRNIGTVARILQMVRRPDSSMM